MFHQKMSVASKIAALKQLFADFGINVYPNSTLEHLIHAEFARGKRSKITAILQDLHQESDASLLARCIGTELKQGTQDADILAIGSVLSERLPGILEIIDVRQATDKRASMLVQLLSHFRSKLPQDAQTMRLHRMLEAVQNNIKLNLDAKIIGVVTEQSGRFCNILELRKFGKVLQQITPALIVLDKEDYPLEQKINLIVNALRALSVELRDTKMERASRMLDNIHWIAKVALPYLDAKVTVEQALQTLGVSVGMVSTKMLIAKAAEYGLTQQEMVQIIYASGTANLPENTQDLIDNTLHNQRYAAICGVLACVAADAGQQELHKICVAGICLASMRQTYCELKTNNLNPSNFSEALGTILIGVGAITKNNTMAHVGNSILTGLKAYSGMMAVPGGSALAIPLAVCSIVGKMLLDTPKETIDNSLQINRTLNGIIQEILQIQTQMRAEFNALYMLLEMQQRELLHALEQGFNNLSLLLRHHTMQTVGSMRVLDQRLQDIQTQLNQEFTELYLEYVHDPLDEVDYAVRYGVASGTRLQESRHKLAMWLLYKSKHPKINGTNYALASLPNHCRETETANNCLSLINRYINTTCAQSLPVDLPHLATWLQAAHAYTIAASLEQSAGSADELKFLEDVIAQGRKIQDFITGLAKNQELWRLLSAALITTRSQLASRWQSLRQQIKCEYLQSLNKLLEVSIEPVCYAHAADMQEQLEPFVPKVVDITTLWQGEISKHIPAVFFAAAANGLGRLEVTYAIDRSVNTFAQLHIRYAEGILPNHSRDVIFRIDVCFKPQASDKAIPLTSTFTAFDLHDPKFRLEEYYKRKFKYGLRHNNYEWISLDGCANHVTGHANTTTHKLIDYERLADVYTEWLQKSKPVNTVDVSTRIQHNPLFTAKYESLITSADCTIANTQAILELEIKLLTQLKQLFQHKRLEFATMLQQDKALQTGLEKLDVYSTIVAVYMRLLNVPYLRSAHLQRFNQLLQVEDAADEDIVTGLDALFNDMPCALNVDAEYLEGEYYQKLQVVLARLALLQTNQHLERLSLSVA